MPAKKPYDAMRLQLLADPKQVEQIDKWRAKQRPIPNRSEAIRMLVDKGLEGERRKR